MKLLLHTCCGPCAVYPIQYFLNANTEVTAYFYNPNIHPRGEHIKRGAAMRTVADMNGIRLLYSDSFDMDMWERHNGLMEDRCGECYDIRISETARRAKEEGYDAFSTSLLISPYQDHDKIRQICDEYARSLGIGFQYVDFRPFFREGQSLAKELGIYRQRYCGCICSLNGNGR